MTRRQCEDYPCCGHELGCCPDYDEEGNQLNIICICGAVLPITSRHSICESCMNAGKEEMGGMDERGYSDFWPYRYMGENLDD